MLRTVKFMALVAMLFVALASSAQVTTSALSGVVTVERGAAVVLHTPADVKNNTMTNIDGRCAILNENSLLPSDEIHPEELIEDGSIKEMLGPLLVGLFALLVSCVFITAILKGKNIKIKCSDIDITIDDSKKEKEE